MKILSGEKIRVTTKIREMSHFAVFGRTQAKNFIKHLQMSDNDNDRQIVLADFDRHHFTESPELTGLIYMKENYYYNYFGGPPKLL